MGIIGTGWISEAHIESYLRCPDVEIVAAADLVPGKAEALFEKLGVSGVRFYSHHKEMLDLETLDVVSVCTYNRAHAECTIDALHAGVHVLVEKPMCVTLDEAIAMCRAEKESGKLLSVGFQPRFDENMQQIGKIVQSGALGKSTMYRRAVAVSAVFPRPMARLLSRMRQPASVPSVISDAIPWIWCSTHWAIRNR